MIHVTCDLTGSVETVPIDLSRAVSTRSLTGGHNLGQLWEEESEESGRKLHSLESRIPKVNVESSELAATVNLPDEQKQLGNPSCDWNYEGW